jgi:integrase
MVRFREKRATMANRAVTLYRKCKTPDGWKRYPAVMSANGKVKPNAVMVGYVEASYTVGHYELRSFNGAKTVWTRIDGGATEALASLKTTQKRAAAKAVAQDAGVTVMEDAGRKNLKDEGKRWIESVEDRGSSEAAELYQRTMDLFMPGCRKVYADELTNDDIRAFHRQERVRGMSDRTIANRHSHLRTFMLYLKFDRDRIKDVAGPKPRFEKRLPEIYEPDELKALFESLNSAYDTLLLDILLQAGLREREAAHLEWRDIHWSRAILKVQSKPLWKHKIKDSEEREMPLSSDLLERLKVYRKQHSDHALIFGKNGGTTDAPDGHLLRRLKSLVRAAGLNCGKCGTCESSRECDRWFLHKFRATYITTLLRNGLDLRTVMTLSGHADIESVMRYLRPAEGKVVQDKVNAIQWR